MSTSDRDLVRRALAGDPESFGDLVERYLPLVRGVILERTRRPDEVPDLVQEVFCHAYQELASLRDPSRFGAWLWQIASIQALGWRRSQERRRRAEGAASVDRVAVWRPDQAAEAGELAERLWEALDQLPVEWRRVVVLAYLEECPHRAIARFLGISPATVRWRLLRARRHLDRELRQAFCQATRTRATSRAEARRQILAVLPGLPLIRLAPPAVWSTAPGRWFGLSLALAVSLGLHGLLGVGISHVADPEGTEMQPVSPRVRLTPSPPPVSPVQVTPAQPRPGARVRLAVATTAVEGKRAFLHFLTQLRGPADQVVPMDRQDQTWAATFSVPRDAAVLFYYISPDSSPQPFVPASNAEGARWLRRYQGQLVLISPTGQPVRGAAHQLALLADLQDQPESRILALVDQELSRHPDNFESYPLRWFLLRRSARDLEAVERQVQVEKQALRDRYPDAADALWVTVDRMQAEECRRFFRRFPRDRNADLAAFSAVQASADSAGQRAAFAEFVEHFPRSPYLDELYRLQLGGLSHDDPAAAVRLADSLISGQLVPPYDARAEEGQQWSMSETGGYLPVAKAYTVRFDLFLAAGDTAGAVILARALLTSGVADPCPYLHLAERLAAQDASRSLAMQLLTAGLPWTREDHLLGLPGFAPYFGEPPSTRQSLRQGYVERARLYRLRYLRELAACQRRAGDLTAAAACLQQAVSLPDNLRQREPEAQPYLDLAAVCESLGRWQGAEAALRRLYRSLGKGQKELQRQLLALCPVAPELQLREARGGTISLAALRGRVVLLYYDQVGPDRTLPDQLDTLEAWQARWGRDGLAVLYVADDWLQYRDGRPEQGRDRIPVLAAERGHPFPFAVDDGTLPGRFGVRGTALVLIDRAGRLRLRLAEGLSPTTTRQVADELAQLLNEREPLLARRGTD